MKFISYLIVLVIFILLGMTAWLYFFPPPETTPVIQENIPQEEQLVAVLSSLTVIQDEVQTKDAATAEFQIVDTASQVGEGWKVKTSATGRAIIESPEITTVVDKNSEITIQEQSNKNTTKIQLEAGNLWAKIQKLFGAGESYQIQTQNAVATVRGTAFGVRKEAGKTTIFVTESSVTVISKDIATGQQIGEEITVDAGQKATVEDGKAPVVETISATDKRQEWYLFNSPTETETPSPNQRQ